MLVRHTPNRASNRETATVTVITVRRGRGAETEREKGDDSTLKTIKCQSGVRCWIRENNKRSLRDTAPLYSHLHHIIQSLSI